MSNIYVYPSGYVDGVLLDDSETDFSTAGLVGALSPTSCIFREVKNNERSVTLEHPIDAEGRYKALVKGYVLSVRVPVMTVPATGDIPIDIEWNGEKTDYPDSPTQGYAFYLHTEDEQAIDVNYYYSASLVNAWRNSSTNVFTMGTFPVIGDTVYTLDSENNIKVKGSVSTVTTSGDTVTSIKIKPNTGSDSKTYSRSATYDREVSGMWYRFGTDGSPIVWKGNLSSEPANPQTNWAYKDTNDGFTYYYANSEWVRLSDSSKMGYVWKYRVKSDAADKKKQRTVYKKKKGGGSLVVLKTGDEVYVIEKDEKEDKRWKVRTPKNGEGYMLPDALELVQGGTYDIRENWKVIQDVVSPWSVTTQLFRIYKVTKSIDSVKVEARDISYDCLNNVYSSSFSGSITLSQLLKNLKTDSFGALTEQQPVESGGSYMRSGYEQINFLTPDGYLIDNITKNEYKGKTLTDVMVNEESGVCSKFNVIRVVDNYNIYFIRDPGINRGFTIQYGKNMLGVDYEVNDDEIVTGIIPVGKNKKGDPLYLGPQKSKDEKKNYIGWYGNIIWSINRDKFPTKRFYVLECDVQAKSDKTSEIDYAMDQMRYLAESKIHAANKQTNAQDGDMDEPKITVTVEFVNLGDTEEYKQFKNLEKCFLHDYVTVRHPDLGIDVTARVTEMEWDCLLDRMNKLTLGNVKENEGRAAQYAAHQAEKAAYLASQIGSDAYDQASEKRRVFTDGTPVPPYDIGDLWITEGKDLMVCINTKYSDETYDASDWELATKYTDTGLIWKGTFASVEDLIEECGNPVDGWAYRNSTEKKSYFYQNGSWNLLTEDGYNGKNTAIVYLYKRSTTTPSIDWTSDVTYSFPQKQITTGIPTGWSSVIPSGADPLYVTAATAYSDTDTDDISSDEWADPVLLGESGSDGLNSATILLYKRSESQPSGNAAKPGSPLTYTFATGSLTGSNFNGWSRTVPDDSRYPCWVIQATAISTGSTDSIDPSEWSSSPAKLVEDGEPGTNGKNTAIVYLYQRSTTAPARITTPTTFTYSFSQKKIISTLPTGWSETIPSGTDPLYITAATACSELDEDTISWNEWAVPVLMSESGADGLNSATIMMYKRASSKPTSTAAAPSRWLDYTFATGALDSSSYYNGWSRSVPTGTAPCWVIQATAISATATDRIEMTEWSEPQKLVEDGAQGEHGVSVITLQLYKRSASTPTTVSGALTYSFVDGSLTPTGNLNNWSKTMPASDGNPCYMIQVSIMTTENTYSIQRGAWSSPVIVVQDGEDGEDGNPGAKGDDGVGIAQNGIKNYYLATNLSSGVTRSTTGWTLAIQQTSTSKKYLWNYEDITLTSGQHSYTDPCIIGMYSGDGRSISQIIEYYAVSNNSSTAPTTWYTTPQAMTPENPYLWNYEIVRYSTGNPEETAKRVIGAYGRSVASTTQYYYLSDTAPLAPTIADPTPLGWSDTQPEYIPGNTDKIYTVIKTTYSTGTPSFSYSPVSELYANAKIDTFISTDESGNTYFKNSANNAAVVIDSVEPSVKLRVGDLNAAKFSKNGFDFYTEDVSTPAMRVLQKAGLSDYYNVVGINCEPVELDYKTDVQLPLTRVNGIFTDHESYSMEPDMYYNAGNFKLYHGSPDPDIGGQEYFVLTTEEPTYWSSDWMFYFTKSGSEYTQNNSVWNSGGWYEAPVWQPNKYYRIIYDPDYPELPAYEWAENSRVRFWDNGQFVNFSGVITPQKAISGSTDLIPILTYFPEMYAPDREINVLCQGSNAAIWMLRITPYCKVYFSRYRSGGSFTTCTPGNWLPFNVTWIRTKIPAWVE